MSSVFSKFCEEQALAYERGAIQLQKSEPTAAYALTRLARDRRDQAKFLDALAEEGEEGDCGGIKTAV